MFESSRKSTGTGYTTTVALLAAAFIFIPGLLVMSGQFGSGAILIASGGSVLCAAAAWIQWKTSSRRFMPSIEGEGARTK